MTEIKWNISQLDCYPDVDGEVDVVVTIHWQCNGTDGTYNGSVYSSTGVTLDAEAPFTPYDQLTKEQVVGWVKDAMGAETVAAHEANVLQQIENQKNPPVVSPKLPWSV